VAELPGGAVDDPEIAGERWLLRRVPKILVHDGVPESSNFREDEEGHGLSVTLWDSAQDLFDIQRDHDDFGVIAVPASVFRDAEAVIVRSPLEGNENHCEIFPRLTSGQQRRCKKAVRWVYYPEWVEEQHRGETMDLYAEQTGGISEAS
jgi:hypothetical protein